MLVTGHPWRSTLDYEGQPENQHGVHLNLAARLSKGWGPSLAGWGSGRLTSHGLPEFLCGDSSFLTVLPLYYWLIGAFGAGSLGNLGLSGVHRGVLFALAPCRRRRAR